MAEKSARVAKTHPSDPQSQLVPFIGGDPVADGRRARRARVLSMTPGDPTEAKLVARTRAFPVRPVHWEYVRPNGVALMVRARDQVDLEEARWDASRVYEAVAGLRLLYMRDRAASRLAWWIADEREAIFVAPRAWPTSQFAAVERHAKAALAALRSTPPKWGESGEPYGRSR